MVYLTVKNNQHNFKIIRRFNEDIWGSLALLEKPSKVLNYAFNLYQNSYKHKKLLDKRSFFIKKKDLRFTYKIVTEEMEFKKRKRSMKRNMYLSMLKLRRFYGNLGKRKFSRLFRQKGLHTNALGRTFAYFLESRLDVILYRANFFTSIFAARQAINHRKIFINGKMVTQPSFKVFINDIIAVSEFYDFYKKLKQKLENNKILINYPSYLEVNYKLGIISLVEMPANDDIPYPFFINLNNITHVFIK